MNTLSSGLTARTVSAAALAAGLVGLSACGGGTDTSAPAAASSAAATAERTDRTSAAAAAAATGTIDVADQTSDGRSVTVAAVSIEAGGKGGWIALHQDADGKPGPVKYFVQVPAGSSSDVSIPTPEGIATGAFWPMLHVDDGVEGTYEFPKVEGADLPAKNGSDIVMKKITVTVQ